MLITFIFLICCLVMVPTVQAEFQPLETPQSGLEFQVGSNFQIKSFAGSMISWKRLSSENRGWRVGLSPVVDSSSASQYNYMDEKMEQEWSQYSLDVVVQKLFLGDLKNKTRSYWGVGPLTGYQYQEERATYYDSQGNFDSERAEIKRNWYLGVSAVVGVEYFFLGNMSLHGEYGFDLKYTFSNSSRYYMKGKYFRVNSRSVRLGLSVLY